jgi:hypothetical protein
MALTHALEPPPSARGAAVTLGTIAEPPVRAAVERSTSRQLTIRRGLALIESERDVQYPPDLDSRSPPGDAGVLSFVVALA